jgi:hypothetical protein
MIIDTTTKAKNYRIVSRIIALVFLTGIAFSFILGGYGWEIPYGQYFLAAVIVLLYLVVAFIRFSTSPSYIYFSNDEGKLIIRFFPLHPFVFQKMAVEFPLYEFAGFEAKKSLFGFFTNLIIFRKYKGKKMRYKPIRLSILSKEERNRLMEALRMSSPE